MKLAMCQLFYSVCGIIILHINHRLFHKKAFFGWKSSFHNGFIEDPTRDFVLQRFGQLCVQLEGIRRVWCSADHLPPMLLCWDEGGEERESVEEVLLRYIFKENIGEEDLSQSLGRWVSGFLLVSPGSVFAVAPSLQSLPRASLWILSVQETTF